MSRLAEVNTTSILAAIRLGCRTMQRVFNADDDQVPFFGSCVLPEPRLSFSAWHSEAHVPGRHLNALLTAEAVAGVRLEEEAVANHRRAALRSYGGPALLPLNREQIGGSLRNFCPHNLREGFHALYALTRYRDDEEAADLFERSIAAINRLWSPEDGWRLSELERLGLQYQGCEGFLHGEARMLGPLVKFHRVTGSVAALELALSLAEKAASEFYLTDGSFDPIRFVTRHVHSITCVLSSLAQLADLLGDAALLGRVRAFYDHGLWEMRDRLGWSPEAVYQQGTDHGEANNTGDILETALILGRWGAAGGYADAEGILRGHLLPAQLRDVSFIPEPANPAGVDGLRQVADRHLGAYGFPAPYGHRSIGQGRSGISFNMDIVGGAVASLCEAYTEVVRSEPTGHWVNLLFDHETPAFRLRSPYTGDGLVLEPRRPGLLFLRLPPWVDRSRMSLDGCTAAAWGDGRMVLTPAASGAPLRVRFPLPESELVLSPRVHLRPIRVKLRGDEVVAMENHGADLTFFAPLE